MDKTWMHTICYAIYKIINRVKVKLTRTKIRIIIGRRVNYNR